MANYDVVIIGTGTAGQTAAYELNAKGLSVAVVEKSDKPGGICALAGCQAKKWFYEGTEVVAKSNHLLGKGVESVPKVAWADIMKEKNRFTQAVPSNTLKGIEKAGINVLMGGAHFIDQHTLKVGEQEVSAQSFIIASGAKTMPLPIDGIEQAINSDQFLELSKLPDRFIFIGGGFISFEFAHFISRLGGRSSRQTTILEAAKRPLGPFDAEMVALLVAASQSAGIEIHTSVHISAIESFDDGFRVRTADGDSYHADVVVNAAGRIADIDDLNLDRAEIEYSRKGITVNHSMQTSQAHIYAVGDCAATIQLARVADYEAMVAANMIAGKTVNDSILTMDYASAPAVLFTYPQYAMVGYTEDAIKTEGIAYKKSFAKNLTWPTYRRIGMSDAAYKILMGVDGLFLGAHIISDNATGIINTIRMAIINRIPVETLYQQSIMTPYPSRESDMLYMLKPLIQQISK